MRASELLELRHGDLNAGDTTIIVVNKRTRLCHAVSCESTQPSYLAWTRWHRTPTPDWVMPMGFGSTGTRPT
jgi:hypothetical protein